MTLSDIVERSLQSITQTFADYTSHGLGVDPDHMLMGRTIWPTVDGPPPDFRVHDVQTIIASILALRARVAELEAGLRSAIKVADEARDEWDAAPSGMKAGKLLIALSGHLKRYRADIDAIHALLPAPPPGGQ